MTCRTLRGLKAESKEVVAKPVAAFEVAEDADVKLKAASFALIAEMEALIRRAKILQLEHKAIVDQRRNLRKK